MWSISSKFDLIRDFENVMHFRVLSYLTRVRRIENTLSPIYCWNR